MIFLHDMISYQYSFLNSVLSWKPAFGLICVLAALPCIFGTSVLRAYLYAASMLIFGCSGVFICKYWGLLIQIWVIGFTIFAFAGFLILEILEMLLPGTFQKVYIAMLRIVSCCCLPVAVVLKYHRYFLSAIILGLCILVFSASEHVRIKNKRQFHTYLDLLSLSDTEEV